MTTIIEQTTENSMFLHGVYFDGKNFVNRYNDVLKNTWVVNCYWTNQNSKFGCEVADLKTNKFCAEYGIENKKW